MDSVLSALRHNPPPVQLQYRIRCHNLHRPSLVNEVSRRILYEIYCSLLSVLNLNNTLDQEIVEYLFYVQIKAICMMSGMMLKISMDLGARVFRLMCVTNMLLWNEHTLL